MLFERVKIHHGPGRFALSPEGGWCTAHTLAPRTMRMLFEWVSLSKRRRRRKALTESDKINPPSRIILPLMIMGRIEWNAVILQD
jgi:hypothetical protein